MTRRGCVIGARAGLAALAVTLVAGCGVVLPVGGASSSVTPPSSGSAAGPTASAAGPTTSAAGPMTSAVATSAGPTGATNAPAQSPTSSTPATPGGASTPAFSLVDPTAAGMASGALVTFRSPSGRIRCLLSRDESTTAGSVEARCDVTDFTYAPTAKPGSCDFDWGPSVLLPAGRPATFGCVSDAVDPGPTLPYGSGVRVGTLTCVSRTEGMTCSDAVSGHGFAVARESYRFW